MQGSRTAAKLRDQIEKFSGDLCSGLCVPAQRFVAETVYGIQASESVLLTEVARTLNEPIALRKTHGRLSRNLQRPELEKVLDRSVLRLAAPRIGQDTLLVLDLSDVTKPYAKKMEYLARVRDGSAHEIGNGYWTLHVMGAEVGTDTLVPLFQRLYSAEAPEFVSENEEILDAVDAVHAHVGKRGLWVIDRGGDRINLFAPLLERQLRFLVRLRGDRHVVYKGRLMSAEEAAALCRRPFSKGIVKLEKGQEVAYTLHFGCCKVRLPEREEALYLLVIDGLGNKPLMLLTTEPLKPTYKRLWHYVRVYMRRWSIEETIRYIKVTYDLENVRVLNYRGLQNLMPLVTAVMYFCACILDLEARLRVMASYVEKAAKRLFGIPAFKYYALADGLRALFRENPGFVRAKRRPKTNAQLPLFEYAPP